MDKIYSRNRRIQLPKFRGLNINGKFDFFYKNNGKNYAKKKITSLILLIMFIAAMTSKFIIQAISPIIDRQCLYMAKNIATKVSNERASDTMTKYKYDDLCIVSKDEKGNIKMISANTIAINEIVSDITLKIEEGLRQEENSRFYINMGSFTGSRLLAGVGPQIKIQMNTIGTIDTKLESVFTSSGINQTLHRIYLQVECEVSVLTPFHTVDERITNQILLTEAVIIGTTPSTYYNFESANENTALEIIE